MQFDYHTLRTFADSWGLLFMLLYFCAVVGWAFRPNAKVPHDEAASIPFKEQ
jgi:cytochrome c oxidase cbb3-type subunit 4